MVSLHGSLTMLVALAIISLSTSFAHVRHDSRSPKHKHAPRQVTFAGIQMLSSPGDPNPMELLTTEVVVPDSIITAIPVPAPTTDPSANPTDPSTANVTETFPVTVLHIPVATICPPNLSIPLPLPHVAPPIDVTPPFNRTNAGGAMLNATSPLRNATDYLYIRTNASIALPTATLADPNARVIFGDNGCQTLFSPTTTAVCSNVISMGGQLPMSVTNCEQLVTFSSSPVCGGVGTATTAAPNGASETMVYFVAPWYDIASGTVPALVQVQTCSSAGSSGSGSCVTNSESWSISTRTEQSTVMQTATFFGKAVGPLNLTLIPAYLTISIPSTNGTATTLSIDTTLAHLTPHAIPTIMRSRLHQDSSQNTSIESTRSVDNTITLTHEFPITRTYQLEAVTHHTTVTVTVTVHRTMTRVVEAVQTRLD